VDAGGRVDLVVPVKALRLAKSRLRGAADGGLGEPSAHAGLTLAMARDTIAAATAATMVRTVIAASPDPEVLAALSADGVPVLLDEPDLGLNAALERGAAALRDRPGTAQLAVGALQADLPALRPAELDAALEQARRVFAAGQATSAFCPDTAGVGTTLLLWAPGAQLVARFGPSSAAAHQQAGSQRLLGRWPGLRRDVDTPADLDAARAFGLGPTTTAVLDEGRRSPVLRSTAPDQ
jgi:2-phospho-L-lactate guanylyltransferase